MAPCLQWAAGEKKRAISLPGSSGNDRLVSLAIDAEGDVVAAGYSDYGGQ